MLNISLKNIQYFLKVAETLNFTEAARELYVSQPALSKQIQQLEKDIDVQLFKRNTKEVELTEGGKIMYQLWSSVIKETEDSLDKARLVNTRHKKRLRIGLVEFSGVIDMIVPIIEAFADMNDDIEIEYSTYGFIKLREKLENHELDMIITFSSEISDQGTGITTKNMKKLLLNIIVSKKNHFYYKDRLEVSELRDEVIYVFADTYSVDGRKRIMEHCKRDGFYPARVKSFPNITSMAVALSSGEGVTLGYHEFFSNISEKLKFFPVNNEMGPHYLVMAWEEQKELSVQKLIKYISSNIDID